MAGIVDQAMQKQMPAKAQAKQETPEVTRIVIAAKKILAQPEIAKKIVQMLRAAQDPATGIAQATLFLMKQLYEKSNGTMPAEAIGPAMQQVMVDIVKIGVAAKVFAYSTDLVQQAMKMAIQKFAGAAQQPAAEQPAQPAAAMPAAPQAAPMQPEPMMGG